MANPENKQIPYESTQKDIRDAIESVATAIGGIAIPSADHVSYDNSGSGLSATDVQNALDEIVSDIPTVNNGTLTIQQNGTSIGSFSANTASNVTANIKTPTADKKTATDQFNTANGGLLSKCQINLVPVQSGSGDPSPDNVRPISGHTEVDLDVKDGTQTTVKQYQVEIGETVYGCEVDLVTGVMTVDKGFITLNGTENITKSAVTDCDIYIYTITPANFSQPFITSAFKYSSTAINAVGYVWRGSSDTQIRIGYAPYGTTTVNDFKTWLSNNPLQICYELATPTTIQLTPQQIETLAGQNNLSTPLSGQSIETNGVEYKELFTFADVKSYVDKKIPDAPTTDGTYTLTATVSSGVATYSWT